MALSKPKWRFELDEFRTSRNKRVLVETIKISGVDDPDIYVAEPLIKWEQSEKGKWVMKHSNPAPSFHRQDDLLTYGWLYHIIAYLDDKDHVYFKLKYE